MKIFVLMADGFEEIETITVVDILKRANLDVNMLTINDFHASVGAHEIEVVADYTLEEFEENKLDYSALIVPGGMEGVENLSKNEKVLDLIRNANEDKKLVAAICAGPLVLEKAGVLESRKATSYPGLEGKLSAEIINDDVVIDDNIITSKGPSTAMNFALELVEYIIDKNKRTELEQDLLVQ